MSTPSEPEPQITYSRPATIAAITSYYDFLTTLYLPSSLIFHPPPTGWPCIVNADPDRLKSLGKSDEVLSLLAHLPYIDDRKYHDAEAGPDYHFADWSALISRLTDDRPGCFKTAGEDLRAITEGPEFAAFASPHAFGLTCGGREEPVIIIDTQFGVVHWEDYSCHVAGEAHGKMEVDYEELVEIPQYETGSEEEEGEEQGASEGNSDAIKEDGHENDDDEEEDEEEPWPRRDDVMSLREKEWRQNAHTWTIPDFFEVLKYMFTELKWLPMSPYCVWSGKESLRAMGMRAMTQDIYRQYGWPDLAAYRKKECLEAVRKAMEERYPESCMCPRWHWDHDTD